jgi:hypothetical protein
MWRAAERVASIPIAQAVARKIVNFVIFKKLAVRALAGFVAKTKQPVLAETIIAFSAIQQPVALTMLVGFRVLIIQTVKVAMESVNIV